MDIASALHNINVRDRRRFALITSISMAIVLFAIFLPFVGPTFLDSAAKISYSMGQERLALWAATEAEAIRDPQVMTKINDVAVIESSIQSSSEIMTSKYCLGYLARSATWMTSSSFMHNTLRMGRVLCFAVIGSREDALSEARLYADDYASNHNPIFGVGINSGFLRFGPYMSLTFESVTHERYDLADAIIASNASYRFPILFASQNQHPMTFGQMFSPYAVTASGDVHDAHQRKIDCSKAHVQPGSFVVYRCVRQGLLPRSDLLLVNEK